MPTLQEIKAQIKALPHRYVFYTKREINYLPKILTDDEEIRALTSGYHGKSTVLLVCTNWRILFVDKGMFFGLKVKQLNLDRIQSIDSSYVVLFGSIRLWDGAASFSINMVMKESIDPFVRAVRDAMQDYRKTALLDALGQNPQSVAAANQAAPQPPISAPRAPVADPVEQLERLARLREAGHLTEEEFQRQKQRILTQA